jgi:hypothetical protein
VAAGFRLPAPGAGVGRERLAARQLLGIAAVMAGTALIDLA